MTGLPHPVLVVGTGLIGTSVALALRHSGVDVLLSDHDPEALAVAVARGAGRPVLPTAGQGRSPTPLAGPDADRRREAGPSHRHVGLVVVAVPPTAVASVVADALGRHPQATVTDVASVKVPVLRALGAAGIDISRYVGGHPMAGREVSGPGAARADLLRDRPWVVAPHPGSKHEAIDAARVLAQTVRALPILMTAAEHDKAVAVVSHAPQVLSSLLAARLLDSTEATVAISGQGLRDMTRIAASDPDLWVEILSANAGPVAEVLGALRRDLDGLLTALSSPERSSEESLADALHRGNRGRGRIPGKHGALAAPTAVVPVAVADRPGELGRLFAAVADAGLQVEDVRIEHVLGRPTGVVEISVSVAAAGPLSAALGRRGWDVRA